ncbi:hypothetical protein LTR56_000091 [Elasticomyces elasticus]|nr:hypothetical protein LTR56_000091 [Elasticomyces elasticus]KAK3667079.1 hypothetical protein LTR22_001943 [Elasticomyces elasticus]KAK4932854.1 hypothetical protein LTR49_000810 [Elasticomyces elasticus]
MAPSKESELLANTWRTITANNPTTPDNPTLERLVYDHISTASSEPTGVTYEDISIDSNHCGPAKWVKPTKASPSHVLLFCHGGGYSFGSLDSHRKMCGHFAKACNSLALMIDYRLTPEHPAPAAVDDCVSGYRWLLDQGFEAKKIVIIGDSCGGGLATTVPLKAIRDGLPSPGAAVALSPWTDVQCETSPSLTSEPMHDVLGAKVYASDEELKTLPPHWISIAGYDMLRDDGTRMAERLQKAGVETVVKTAEGMQHVFEFMAGRAPEADASIKAIGEWVRKQIGS